MPDANPSNAPDPAGDGVEPMTRDTAARQVENAGAAATPGGGGLGGAGSGAEAADPLGGSGRAPEGASPNSPIDTGIAGSGGGGTGAEREAQLRALDDDAPEPHPGSQ